MNPFDFYYLDDFLKFSPLSPNYANLNMVSSPWLRSPCSASASLPVSENSSEAYHKEIYTVLFDPPSFLMVYSIVCHLWKKSKIEKKFLPLPPLLKPPQQLLINFAIASTMDEDNDLDSDFAIASTMDEDEDLDCAILEKSNSEFAFACFSFGNFQSDIIPIKSIEHVKPKIRGFIIKIGEISCFLREHHDSAASSFSFPISEINDELMKFPNTSNSSATTSLESEFVVSESAKKSNVLVTNMVLSCYGFVASIDGHEPKVVTAVFATVFDPGGVAELILVARFSGTITLTLSMSLFFRLVIVFAIEFAGEFALIVFDPGGNQLISVLVNY
ncbi:hypothetical protein QL285_020656 [Trifolium repens]|nr:hypothetical protein QL285_020656 [Trifolium repens]